MVSYILLSAFCIGLLFYNKEKYLRKNKKGKYTLSIPKNERIAENIIKQDKKDSIIFHHKKRPTHQYKSLNETQLNKLAALEKQIINMEKHV